MPDKKDINEMRKEVKQRMDEFSKRKTTVDELISGDKTDFKELLKTNDILQEMCSELLTISKELSAENDKLRSYLENDKNKIVAEYYRKKLEHTGILDK